MKSTLAMGWIALFMSLLIAACAAYFSITGLAVLFAAALIPVIIMATVLEVGKIGATFFLHRFWEDLPFQLKYPLSIMVVILMIITSMGIFGFLSKGHIEQEAPSIGLNIDIADADAQIESHKERIAQYEEQKALINGSIKKMIEFARVSRKGGALDKMKEFQPQLDAIQAGIDHQKEQIRALRKQKSTALREVSGIEAKLGPIKYVAELFGFDLKQDPDGKGKAVRIVIVMFMLAFDPLAIWLVMASDWAFLRYRRERKEVVIEKEESELEDLRKRNDDLHNQINEHLLQDERIDHEIDDQITEIAAAYEQIVNTKDKEIAALTEMLETTEKIEHVVFKEIEVPVEVYVGENSERLEELEAALAALYKELEEKEMELQDYLDALKALEETLDEKPKEVEKIVEVENTDQIDELSKALDTSITQNKEANDTIEVLEGEVAGMNVRISELTQEVADLQATISKLNQDIQARDMAVQNLGKKYNLVDRIPGLGIVADNAGATKSTGFGTEFPANPSKGDKFLRVDDMPSKLYMYEGTRWIEADKNNDVEYDEQYLNHLINELGDGNVEMDDLSQKEQDEIQNLLKKEDVLGK